MGDRWTFGVIKTIAPFVEGDRSDCQPSTTTNTLIFELQAVELAFGLIMINLITLSRGYHSNKILQTCHSMVLPRLLCVLRWKTSSLFFSNHITPYKYVLNIDQLRRVLSCQLQIICIVKLFSSKEDYSSRR